MGPTRSNGSLPASPDWSLTQALTIQGFKNMKTSGVSFKTGSGKLTTLPTSHRQRGAVGSCQSKHWMHGSWFARLFQSASNSCWRKAQSTSWLESFVRILWSSTSHNNGHRRGATRTLMKSSTSEMKIQSIFRESWESKEEVPTLNNHRMYFLMTLPCPERRKLLVDPSCKTWTTRRTRKCQSLHSVQLQSFHFWLYPRIVVGLLWCVFLPQLSVPVLTVFQLFWLYYLINDFVLYFSLQFSCSEVVTEYIVSIMEWLW